MNWNQEDNKRRTGKPDSDFVSLSEPYEVDYFCEQYIKRRGQEVNAKNKEVLKTALKDYPGASPIKRESLIAWLDLKITVTPELT